MKVLFLSAIAEFLISEIKNSLTEDQACGIEFFDELDITLEEADLIFMDYSLSEFKDLFYDVLKHKNKVALIIGEDDYGQINRILYDTGVHHLFTIADNLDRQNFVMDMKEFILNWQKNWKLGTFYSASAISTTILVDNSKNINEQVQKLFTGHDFSKSFDELPNIIEHILEEAIPNAIFHAPVDHQGHFLYRGSSRSDAVLMIPGKEVEIKLISDEKNIVISVKDFYGTLTPNNIFDYLPKEGEERKEGSKLGMYLIFRYGHKYIINVVHNKSTELIVIIENTRRFKNYDLREKSFHFRFEEDGQK